MKTLPPLPCVQVLSKSQKKRMKQKAKAAAAATTSDGDATAEDGVENQKPQDTNQEAGEGDEVEDDAGGDGAAAKKKKKKKKKGLKQTEPPSIPLARFFPDDVYPEGEWQSYRDECVLQHRTQHFSPTP